MKSIFKIIMFLIILIIIVLGGLILFASLTQYRPGEKTLVLHSDEPTLISDTAEISMLTWNVGYAGLGDDMDFFYDGGSKMRTSRQRTLENQKAIMEFLKQRGQTDFLFLQEVDKHAKRSFYINMPDSINRLLPGRWNAYGQNYLVNFVPVPYYAPMGYVDSGILTSSIAAPIISERISYPGRYPWPDRLFNLNRCLLLSRYEVMKGKQLVIINTHNSAFDDGSLRKMQMEFLKKILTEEYSKGNYVIAGGDWNQCPPYFKPEFSFNMFDTINRMQIPDDFIPGWKWVYDSSIPTNRRLKTPYNPASTLTTVIDYFLISPNIELIEVEGIHLDFINSDHNPVFAKVKLKGYQSAITADH